MSSNNITTLSNLTNTTATSATAATGSSDLGKDAFLQLLVTQMKYQDPLDPVDNSEMLAQLAQFSALEQMNNVAKASQNQLANSMLGKYVMYTYTSSSTGETFSLIGKVDYVKVNGNEPTLGIGEHTVALDDVVQVVDESNIETTTTAFQLLGKTVLGKFKRTNTTTGEEETVTVEGEVLGITMKDGKPYMIIGTGSGAVEVDFDNISNVVEETSITGRQVTGTYIDANGDKQTVEGTAEYILIDSTGTYVYIDGHFVAFDDVTTVMNNK